MFSYPEDPIKIFLRVGLVILLLAVYIIWAATFYLNYKSQQIAVSSEISHLLNEEVVSQQQHCSTLLNVFRAECSAGSRRSAAEIAREVADLKAQQEMARWALVASLIGVPTVGLSGLGVIAIYWTFREQRKILQNQERAILEIEGAAFWPMKRQSSDHVQLEVAVRNVGRTAAKSVKLSARIMLLNGQTSYDNSGIKTGTNNLNFENAEARLQMIAAGKLDVLATNQKTNIDFTALKNTENELNQSADVNGSVRLIFSGRVNYKDIFDREHVEGFWFESQSASENGPHHFIRGTRHWRAAAYEELAIEQQESIRARVKERFASQRKNGSEDDRC